MPSKIGALIRCYSITDYLPFVLKNYAWVDKIVVMNYRFISAEPRGDDTTEIVKEYIDASFENLKVPNIAIYKGEGLQQHEILNEGLKHLQCCDIVFISDADEFMTQAAMCDIAKRMVTENKNLGYARIIDYAFDFYHRFNNRHLHGALVAVKPQETEFVHIRQTRDLNPRRMQFEHKLHHFGFVLPPKTMKWKLQWESKEEKIDVVKGIGETPLVLCEPPEKEILELMGEI
jgi:hypothetical protein